MRDWLVSLVVGAALVGCASGAGQESTPDFSTLTAPGPGPADLGATDLSAPPGPRCTGKTGSPGDTDNLIAFGGAQRRYLLHIPPGYDPTVPMPLILAFHGFTDHPENIRDSSHWNDVADQRGYLVAYPAGRFDAWNAGACCGLAVSSQIDDVGFTKTLLDALEQELCVDDARVFANGFSNGGFLAHRLACEVADRFAAIGVVSGQEAMATCTPSRPVPVVQVHGNADPVVPYIGNPVLGFPSTQATIDGWAMRDGCAATATQLLHDGNVTCVARDACTAGTDVVLCTNSGGGHNWVPEGDAWTGATPPEGFVATTYFADFFDHHPMP